LLFVLDVLSAPIIRVLSSGWRKEELKIFSPEGQRKRGKEGKIGEFPGFGRKKREE
jgi:hypothetical protein